MPTPASTEERVLYAGVAVVVAVGNVLVASHVLLHKTRLFQRAAADVSSS